VDGVEQPVTRELRVKGESDEPALQTVVDGKREGRADVGIDRGLIGVIEQVQETARVVGEPAAVWKIAHEAHARPARRRDVLVGRTEPARIRQPNDVLDLNAEPTFDDRIRDRIRDLRVNRDAGEERHERNDDGRER
jgi:hypothetical protein